MSLVAHTDGQSVGVDPGCQSSVPANSEGWSALVIVGDCRGREEEWEGEKKKGSEWIRLPRESQLTWSHSL